MKYEKGLALEDILREVHLTVMRSKCIKCIKTVTPGGQCKMFFCPVELPPRVLNMLIIKMAEIEARLAGGCTEKPQISALVAAFYIGRNLVTLES